MNTGLENIGNGQAVSGPNTCVYSHYLEAKAMVAYLALVLRLWVTLTKDTSWRVHLSWCSTAIAGLSFEPTGYFPLY